MSSLTARAQLDATIKKVSSIVAETPPEWKTSEDSFVLSLKLKLGHFIRYNAPGSSAQEGKTLFGPEALKAKWPDLVATQEAGTLTRAHLKLWQTFGWLLPDDQNELVEAWGLDITKTDGAKGVVDAAFSDSQGMPSVKRAQQTTVAEIALSRFRKKVKLPTKVEKTEA